MDLTTKTAKHAAIQVEGLTRRYGRTTALDQVDLSLEGGTVGLLGPNGAGKTTLLSVLATVAAPDKGRLRLLGLDPAVRDERIRIRRRLGFVPQDLGVHRHFRVADFIDYVAILKEIVDKRQRREEVARVLAVADLEAVASKRMLSLSGGTRRRVVIAQSLLGRPDLLVFDEPVAGLDPEQRLRFRALLSDLPGAPVVVLSTHQADDVVAVCSTVVVLIGGRVRFVGTPEQLADLATGHVWLTGSRVSAQGVSWRTGDGVWRHVGAEPGSDAQPAEPTVEDAYLLLSGSVTRAGADL